MSAPLPQLAAAAFDAVLVRGEEPGEPLPLPPPPGPDERELPWDDESFPDDEFHPEGDAEGGNYAP